ncbi:FAD-linked oxidoreductase-like protein [Aspergillus cavernicola]|uniref:Proline dehydrogenase n=1 Tax=Aspergillus cavernicola TaxID=176166 RepID=A0ABR4J379_9EURO
MVILSAAKPAIPRVVTFTPRCGISTFNNSKNSTGYQRVRSSSTSVLPEIKATQETRAPLPPLSALPTSVLLRSLLVATISSKPYLLLPSLSILSFLCKPRKGALLDVDRNPIIHGILKSTFYKQFCAGETHDEVKGTIKQLNDMGFQGTIMTYAKETVFDHKTNTQHGLGIAVGKDATGTTFCPHIEAWRKGTVETVELLGENDYLAVKLTGAGPTVTTAFSTGDLPPQQMLDALEEISTKCKDRGIRILVDAESQHFQSGILRVTLDLMRKYNRDGYASIYNTYQAYLKSTASTLDKHLTAASEEGFTLGLKLVRGAYIASDERSLIHDTKQDTDDAYNGIAQGALRQEIGTFGTPHGRSFPSVNLFLASHNKESVLAAHSLHQQRLKAKLPTVAVGFAQLHGMSDEVSFSLLQMKKGADGDPRVYKCSTWGGLGECLAYLLRRAIENRDAVGRTGEEYLALRAEARRRFFST